MGETLEFLEGICEGCKYFENCRWDYNPEECPHADFS